MSGALVVLEGAEGVGKSTQLRRLVDTLRAAGRDPVVVREPGGTPIGDALRHLLLEAPYDVEARTEALLFMASRAQLVASVVRPALAEGRLVVTDRFFLSTYAYQAWARGLGEEAIRAVNGFATDGLVPDLTLLIDLPPGEGAARVSARGAPDRLERSGDDFHARVADAFRRFATPAWQAEHPECGPICLIDGQGAVEAVERRIHDVLATRLPETFGALRGSHSR